MILGVFRLHHAPYNLDFDYTQYAMSHEAGRNEVAHAEEHPAPLNHKSILQQSPATVDYRPDWNTNKLALRIASDTISAASAAGLVAPLITIFDRYGNS